MVIVGGICVFTHFQQVQRMEQGKGGEKLTKLYVYIPSKYTLVTHKHCLQ